MSKRRPYAFLAVFLLAAPVAVAGCGGGPDSASKPSRAATVTRTVSAPAATAPSSRGTAQPPGATVTAPPARSAAETVAAYYAAINAGNFREAWNLGGRHFASSYGAFVAGFDGLASDRVTVLSTGGHTVTLELAAVQSDGSVKVFEGSMSVSGGEITGANIHEVTAPEPSGPVFYKNCTDAHQHRAYDIPKSSPAYRAELDRDNDGLACEPYEGN